MNDLVDALVPIACGCVLPIVTYWLYVRDNMNESKNRTQIVLAAIEKNSDMDLEELMNKISPKKKLLKEKLLTRLLWGGIIALVGFSIIVCGLWIDWKGGMPTDTLFMVYSFGGIIFAVGFAFIINYLVGKKMLAKEMEIEQSKLLEHA